MATTDVFLSALKNSPHEFLQPSLPLYTDSVAYLKHVLDPLARDVSAEQQRRLQDARKKRKRGQNGVEEEEGVLRLKQIHAEGFGVEQVWEQARRVIDAARLEAERSLEEIKLLQGVGFDDEGSENDATSAEESDDEDFGVEGVDYEVEGEDVDLSGEEDEDDMDGGLEDGDDVDMADDYDELDDQSDDDKPAEEFVADKFGLNDGFFSIDDFNKQSEFLEQQDARGENDDAGSDEEDVDWDVNPFMGGPVKANANGLDEAELAEESEEEDDDNGPTFGNPDAPSEDEDDVDGGELDGAGEMSNANDVMYADFFAPPALKKKKKNQKNKPSKPNGTGPKLNGKATEAEDDMERTMAAVHRDLFEDDESVEDEDEVAEEVDPSDPRSRRSTHERRKAAIAEEIRKLEAANVAKREWMLSGEARAADRPMNSLLEEDLDFERAGKPIPVITAEVSEDIEDLIKRRILAYEFQDIIRRRPDDLATGKGSRRGRVDFELDDTKNKKSLAEEYEEEHLRRIDPNFTSADDEKLSKEHAEITALWKEVSGQLDSLSSWNFRPKQPVAQIDIRVDAPVIAMEDARPNAGAEIANNATASQLAPQEVYKAGEASKGLGEEVVGKSGLPAGREELSREERKRRRRREKERIRKGNTNGNGDGETGAGGRKVGEKEKEKRAMIGDLKRGGVKVIGNKGEVRDVEGRKVGASGEGGGQGAARFKL